MAGRSKALGFGGAAEADGRAAPSTSGMGTIGTTRNRTDLFLKYRRQARGGSKPLAPPGTVDTGCVAGRAPALPVCHIRRLYFLLSLPLPAPAACAA